MFQSKILRFQNKYGLKLIEGQGSSSPPPIYASKKILEKHRSLEGGSSRENEVETTETTFK